MLVVGALGGDRRARAAVQAHRPDRARARCRSSRISQAHRMRRHDASARGALRCVARALALLAALAAPQRCRAGAAPPRPTASAPRRAAPAPAPAAQIRLALQHVGGNPPFALVGARIVVRGDRHARTSPGRRSRSSFYRDGRKVGVQDASACSRSATARAVPRRLLEPLRAGSLQARAAHDATAAAGRLQRALAQRPLRQPEPRPGRAAGSRCGCCSPSWTRCTTRCR